MSRGTLATIHCDALTHNLNTIRQLCPGTKAWAVVKADAYGHGASQAASAMKDADGYAVATFGEGVQLRRQGFTLPVLLLEGCVSREQTEQAMLLRMEMVWHNDRQLEWLERWPHTDPMRIWIKVDSGMHRLGFTADEALARAEQISQKIPDAEIGFLTHFARADELDHPLTHQQLEHFAPCRRQSPLFSMANSAASLCWPEAREGWIRPGIALYGATPFADKPAADFGLQPAMTLTAPIIATHHIRKGESVGYGGRWTAERDSILATLAIGYGDGYPRHAPDGTPTWLNGHIAPISGRVAMDMIIIDITGIPGAGPGDNVELWGRNLPVDEVAKHIDTIGYELLTRVSSRVPRQYES